MIIFMKIKRALISKLAFLKPKAGFIKSFILFDRIVYTKITQK